jgi:hypothetical protein
MKLVSQLDSEGYFIGPAEADYSPLETDVLLMPAGCVDVGPFEVPEGHRAKWDGKEFFLEAIPEPIPEPEPVLTPEQIKGLAIRAIQLQLDDFARTRGYDSLLSACSYAASSIPKFAAEARCCLDLRDTTWATAANLLAASDPASPPTVAQVLAALPVPAWPA